MTYSELSYLELKTECATRGLGGSGTKDELMTKLINDDMGLAQEPQVKPIPKGVNAKDFNPERPNYDYAGRWIRRDKSIRPDGAICKGGWNDEHITGWMQGCGPLGE